MPAKNFSRQYPNKYFRNQHQPIRSRLITALIKIKFIPEPARTMSR